jgi:hypothetical protein
MILEWGRRRSFLPSTCCNCSNKERIHLCVTFGDKTEVNGVRNSVVFKVVQALRHAAKEASTYETSAFTGWAV